MEISTLSLPENPKSSTIKQITLESSIGEIKERILSIDLKEAPFSESYIKRNGNKNELLLILERLNITLEEHYYKEKRKKEISDPCLTPEEELEWLDKNKLKTTISLFGKRRYFNDKYNYYNLNKKGNLKHLAKLIQSENNTSYLIDFNDLNQGDIDLITNHISNRYKRICIPDLNMSFLKESTIYQENIGKLNIKEKKVYIEKLELELTFLQFSEFTYDISIDNLIPEYGIEIEDLSFEKLINNLNIIIKLKYSVLQEYFKIENKDIQKKYEKFIELTKKSKSNINFKEFYIYFIKILISDLHKLKN